jgi:hypothetical protein
VCSVLGSVPHKNGLNAGWIFSQKQATDSRQYLDIGNGGGEVYAGKSSQSYRIALKRLGPLVKSLADTLSIGGRLFLSRSLFSSDL